MQAFPASLDLSLNLVGLDPFASSNDLFKVHIWLQSGKKQQ
jgi:hypothetical protein